MRSLNSSTPNDRCDIKINKIVLGKHFVSVANQTPWFEIQLLSTVNCVIHIICKIYCLKFLLY